MVEVGGSNPPGPTKRETLAIGGGFSFGGLSWVSPTTAVRQHATSGACWSPERSDGAPKG